MRLLPEITPWNQWYWTAGEDAVLRIQGCADCGQLVHPPQPICPSCGSRSSAPTDVSGRAVVAGYTVNSHVWGPDPAPPYVVAIVMLEEDRSVRLTTNVVGCEPDEVHVGQVVEVEFLHEDDVWIPVFHPTGETVANPVEEVPLPAPRPPLGDDRFEHRSVISGIGRSKVGRRLMVEPLSLTVDACLAAVADAGLELSDIDGLSTYPGAVGMGMSEGGVSALEDALRIHPTWINGGGDIPGQGGAVIAAMQAVANGLCRHVLCFRTVWEATFAALRMGGGGSGRMGGMMEWRAPYGAMSAAHWIAPAAHQYMHRFGATRELLGYIALNGRRNAGLNPGAIYRDPMTMDDYMSARQITSPFGLYDCDVPCDGAVTLVVSDASVAGDLLHPAVRIDAVGTQLLDRTAWDQGTLTHEPQVMGQAAHLWTRTDLTPGDVDVALLYDGFSFNCVSWIEGLGFCGVGEAQDWMDGGARIALDGDLPLNPHGGQLSEGRLHGFGFLHEAVVQLRGDGGERQVPGAATAVVSTGGGTPSSAFLFRRNGA